MHTVNEVSGSTHSYLSRIRAFFEKLFFDPNSVVVPAVFLAGALFFCSQRSGLFPKKGLS